MSLLSHKYAADSTIVDSLFTLIKDSYTYIIRIEETYYDKNDVETNKMKKLYLNFIYDSCNSLIDVTVVHRFYYNYIMYYMYNLMI
jgi:hypothetical protein